MTEIWPYDVEADRYVVIGHDEAHDRKLPGHESLGEWGYGVWRCEGGEPVELIGTDGGEPEDQLLVRDWSWVAPELCAAYAAGLAAGRAAGLEEAAGVCATVIRHHGATWQGVRMERAIRALSDGARE